MRNKIVMGNWKMNGSLGQVDRLLNDLLALLPKAAKPACVVFPPSIYLPRTCELLTDSPLMWGAQNVYPRDCGAYTGELSAPMLMDYDCRYVLVGHSERRSLCHEDEKFVAEKFHHVKEHGMIPVLCIGETLEARDQGLTEHVLEQQLRAVIKTESSCFDECVLAYEPVWAIGTGQTATPDQVQAVHSFIRRYVARFDRNHAEQIQIVYGGSVSEKNAQAIFAMPDVDGGLVGGASLNARQFVEIVKCINCY